MLFQLSGKEGRAGQGSLPPAVQRGRAGCCLETLKIDICHFSVWLSLYSSYEALLLQVLVTRTVVLLWWRTSSVYTGPAWAAAGKHRSGWQREGSTRRYQNIITCRATGQLMGTSVTGLLRVTPVLILRL